MIYESRSEQIATIFNSSTATYIESLFAEGNSEYYVSSFTGSDSNQGSIVFPFLTIQHAIDVANATNTPSTIYLDGVFDAGCTIHNTNASISLIGKSRFYNGANITDSNTIVNDYVQISGTVSDTIFIQGISFIPQTALEPVILVTAISNFFLYLQDLELQDNGSGTVVDITSPDTGLSFVLVLDNIQQASGIINLTDYTSSSGTLLLLNTVLNPNVYVGSNWFVFLATANAISQSWSGDTSAVVLEIQAPQLVIEDYTGNNVLELLPTSFNLNSSNGTGNIASNNDMTVASGSGNLNLNSPNAINMNCNIVNFTNSNLNEIQAIVTTESILTIVAPGISLISTDGNNVTINESALNLLNNLIDDVNSINFGVSTSDGTWRITQQGGLGLLLFQILISSVWTTSFAFNITSPVQGQTLKYDSASSSWLNAPNSVCSYGPLSTAPTTSPVTIDGYTIAYNATVVGSPIQIKQASGTSSGQFYAQTGAGTTVVSSQNSITITTTFSDLASTVLVNSVPTNNMFLEYFLTLSSTKAYKIYVNYSVTTGNISISVTKIS